MTLITQYGQFHEYESKIYGHLVAHLVAILVFVCNQTMAQAQQGASCDTQNGPYNPNGPLSINFGRLQSGLRVGEQKLGAQIVNDELDEFDDQEDSLVNTLTTTEIKTAIGEQVNMLQAYLRELNHRRTLTCDTIKNGAEMALQQFSLAALNLVDRCYVRVLPTTTITTTTTSTVAPENLIHRKLDVQVNPQGLLDVFKDVMSDGEFDGFPEDE